MTYSGRITESTKTADTVATRIFLLEAETNTKVTVIRGDITIMYFRVTDNDKKSDSRTYAG